MIVVYGTTDTSNGMHIDTSKTLRGAKQYATRNDLKTVSIRVGYNATVLCEKVGGKWVNLLGEDKKAECYIEYLDSTNKYKPTKKDFNSYEEAYNFMLKTFDTVNTDLINYH